MTAVEADTEWDVMVKVAVVALAFTVTVAGTLAAPLLLLDNETVSVEGAGPVSVTVPVEFALPPITVVGDRLSDLATGGMIVRVAVCITPWYVAVIVATTDELTALVVIVNVAVVDPAGTVTLPGSEAEPLLLCNEIAAPPLGATPFNVTVPVTFVPPVTVDGFNATPTSDAGLTVNVAEIVLAVVAEMLTAVVDATPCEVIAKDAAVAPGATMTWVGTLATALLLDARETITPEVPAGAAIVTVPVPAVPPITAEGDTATDNTLGGFTVNSL